MDQLSFSDLEFTHKRKITRREQFLAEMDKVVPWSRLEKHIDPFYPKAGNGRKPYPLNTMLRIYCMQQWYNLSDPAMEEMLYEVYSMQRFAGLSLTKGFIPDETTILNFRHLLEKHQLTERILHEVTTFLQEKQLMLRKGTIVDATIIAAPSSTKNQKKERDTEMHQTKKGNQWYFGLKTHVGVDAKDGLVHSVYTSAANMHDVVASHHLLHGEEEFILGDSGYRGAEKREEFESVKATWLTVPRPSELNDKKLKKREQNKLKKFAKKLSSIRSKVEHVFRIIKCQFGFTKTRYRGLAKNDVQLKMLFALANLYKARKAIIWRSQEQSV